MCPDDRYYTVNEIAAYLNCCPTTVYRAAASGRMKAKKCGRTWRIKKEWADAFLFEQS